MRTLNHTSLGILAFLFGGLLTHLAFAESPFPFKVGTKWIYATSDGTDISLLVEGHASLSIEPHKVPAAIVRRSDGADRLVFQSEHRWFECGSLSNQTTRYECRDPMQFFAWPLHVGSEWRSGNLDFVVTAKEAVEVPWRKFPQTWRIAYMPAGSKDPMGEMWLAEGVGRIRIIEQEVRYELTHFEPGHGPNLAWVPESLLVELEEGAPLKQPPLSWTRRLGIWAERISRPWVLVFMTLLIGIVSVLYLGLGLRKAIQSNASDEEFAFAPDPQEEGKLLAAVAQSGDFQKAREHFQSLIERNPRYPDLRLQLGIMLRAEGRFAEAQSQFAEALKLNPRYTEARLALANLLLGTGQHAQAEEEFKMVLHTQPDYADAHLGRGKALMHLGRTTEAVEALERTLTINPNLDIAQELLAQCRKDAQM